MISASTESERAQGEAEGHGEADWFHSASVSANFTAFQAGNLMLCAAPQNHQSPGLAVSGSGSANCIEVSSATLKLFGLSGVCVIENPASLQALWMRVASAEDANSAQAENVTP